MQNQPTPEQIAQELAKTQQINFNRGRTRIGEIIEAIGYTCLAAEQGDVQAKNDLKGLLNELERAKAASVGVIYGGGANGPPPK